MNKKQFYIMKKILFILIMCFVTMTTFAQNTIKFLGIPVDGSKKEMIAKLENKGYEYDSTNDCLFGEFNGEDVLIRVQTVNNKVWRLAVLETTFREEADVRIHFNNLFRQFSNNEKYVIRYGKEIDEGTDISYEMIVHNKRYDMGFGFKDTSINGNVWYTLVNDGNDFSIAIFYENLNNAANGDDL